MSNDAENAFSHNRIVKFIDERLDTLKGMGKPALEVAREAGYTNPNIMSMFRTGRTKVPLDRVVDLAKGLEVDPAIMLEMALEQFWPNETKTIRKMIGRTVTANEFAIVEHIRSLTKHADPALTPAIKSKLTEIFSKP